MRQTELIEAHLPVECCRQRRIVGGNEQRATAPQFEQCLSDFASRLTVEMGGGFIRQNQLDRGVGSDACQSQAQRFASGQAYAALTKHLPGVCLVYRVQAS
ncbi:hypothetical protein D3C81_1508500 [compost metagenome]